MRIRKEKGLRSRFGRLPLLVACLCSGLGSSHPARAMSRDVGSVLKKGAYGLAAGTVAGALSLPATHSANSVAIGAAVGLYAGIAVGMYGVLNHDDGGDP